MDKIDREIGRLSQIVGSFEEMETRREQWSALKYLLSRYLMRELNTPCPEEINNEDD